MIKCRAVRHMQRQFIKNLVKELLKVNKRKVDEEIVLDMIEDIIVYFDNGDEEEYTTSQQYIGIRELFRGYIVKDWVGSNFNCDTYNELNKIVVV